MIVSVDEQARLFAMLFLAGMLCGAVYEVIKVFRKNIRHKAFFIYAEDITYWLVVTAFVFMFMLGENHAEIRFFDICGFFSGMVIYRTVFGKAVFAILDFAMNVSKRLFILFMEIILTPFRLIWLIIGKPVTNGYFLIKVYCQKVLHSGAVYVKINRRMILNRIKSKYHEEN